jgi:hypothetical protein
MNFVSSVPRSLIMSNTNLLKVGHFSCAWNAEGCEVISYEKQGEKNPSVITDVSTVLVINGTNM